MIGAHGLRDSPDTQNTDQSSSVRDRDHCRPIHPPPTQSPPTPGTPTPRKRTHPPANERRRSADSSAPPATTTARSATKATATVGAFRPGTRQRPKPSSSTPREGRRSRTSCQNRETAAAAMTWPRREGHATTTAAAAAPAPAVAAMLRPGWNSPVESPVSWVAYV